MNSNTKSHWGCVLWRAIWWKFANLQVLRQNSLNGSQHFGFFFPSLSGKNVEILPLPNNARWWFQAFFMFIPIWGRFPFWLIFFKWVETNQITKQRIHPIGPTFFPRFLLGFLRPKASWEKAMLQMEVGGAGRCRLWVVGGWFAFSTEKSINEQQWEPKNIEFLSVKFAARIVFLVESWKIGCLTRAGKQFLGGQSTSIGVFVVRNPSFATGWFWALFVYGSFTQEPGDLGSGRGEMVTSVWQVSEYDISSHIKNIHFEVGKDLFFVYGFLMFLLWISYIMLKKAIFKWNSESQGWWILCPSFRWLRAPGRVDSTDLDTFPHIAWVAFRTTSRVAGIFGWWFHP